MPMRRRIRLDIVAVLIVLLGVGLRCISLRTGLLDVHGQRQLDTATMARYFVEDSFNPFYPQVIWGGPQGYVESEFPVLPILAALLYKLFGSNDTWGRVVAVVFSGGSIWAMYALGRALFGSAAGRAAAFLVAVSPSAVYYGRTFMPEAPMFFFSIAGVLYFVRYFDTGRRSALWIGAALSAMAWLAKLPALITLAPIAAAGWTAKRQLLLKDRDLFIAVGAALLVTVAWYWHAGQIYATTGLTIGIHPPKSYPLSIAAGPWEGHTPKWSTLTLLTDAEFYRTIFRWIYFVHLTPAGFAVAAVGAALCTSSRRLVADFWLVAMLVFIAATAEVSRFHDYYQLLILPAGALYFGWVAGPLFDGAWLNRSLGLRRTGAAMVGCVIVMLGLMAFYYSGVLSTHFRVGMAGDVANAGVAVGEAAGQKGFLVVVDGYGVNSPVLLYHAHMRGWSFDPQSLTPAVLERLHKMGARYFATTRWPDVRAANTGVREYLEQHRRIELPKAPEGTVMFDLDTFR
jgi:4-amino-4-deoxy-L-arabinose transferase-like glycosyltransferase